MGAEGVGGGFMHAAAMSGEVGSDWLDRPEWRDVAALSAGLVLAPGNGAVEIDYPSDYRMAVGVMGHLLKSGERSERVLWLSQHVIEMNDTHYTAWQLRRECLTALGSDLSVEKVFVDAVSMNGNNKNYQLWNHRRHIVKQLGTSVVPAELEFVRETLSAEPKHYHAWAHRQWLVQEFVQWEAELSFCEECIDADVRNNSAWNHRFFVVSERPMQESRAKRIAAAREAEFEFAVARLSQDVDNESVWNYLRGLFPFEGVACDSAALNTWFPRLLRVGQLSLESSPDNAFAMAFLADVKAAQALMVKEDCARGRRLATEALDLWRRLHDVDPLRAPYWGLRASEAQSLVLSLDTIRLG